MSVDASPAAALAESVRSEIAAVERAIRGHRMLELAEEGRVPAERLRDFAREQQAIVSSDRRSFALLAARFPEPPAGDVFLSLAQGEGEALRLLEGLAAALGMGPGELLAAERLSPQAQAYPGCLARLALGGGRADVALAMLVNLDAWGACCGRLARALVEHGPLDDRAVGFLRFFSEPPPELARGLLEVVDQGLRAGEPAPRARAAARALQAYELMFWDAMAEGLG